MNIESIENIYINGKVYKVLFVDDDMLHGKFGMNDLAQQKIWIDKKVHNQQKLDSLIHEILHVIDIEGYLKLGEEGVTRLASMFTQVILDNFILRKK